jgi:hypothetical protein
MPSAMTLLTKAASLTTVSNPNHFLHLLPPSFVLRAAPPPVRAACRRAPANLLLTPCRPACPVLHAAEPSPPRRASAQHVHWAPTAAPVRWKKKRKVKNIETFFKKILTNIFLIKY